MDDLELLRILHGKAPRRPDPHALIKNINTTRAEKSQGVKAGG